MRDMNKIMELYAHDPDLIVYGTWKDEKKVLQLLGADKNRYINIVYIDRFNLTIRNCLAPFI